jgi:hypothetical protein
MLGRRRAIAQGVNDSQQNLFLLVSSETLLAFVFYTDFTQGILSTSTRQMENTATRTTEQARTRTILG